MFEKAFQGAPAFEILSPQGANPTANWKISGVQRLFDKNLKGYVFHVAGNALMQLPREDKPKLGLVQPILVMQVYLPQGKPFSVEIGITDATRTRRRLLFSSTFKEMSTNPLHARFPLVDSSSVMRVRRNCWVNLCFDIDAMVPKAWPGQHYKTLDSLQISPDCRLRKVYTIKGTKGQPMEMSLLRMQDGTHALAQLIDGSGPAIDDSSSSVRVVASSCGEYPAVGDRAPQHHAATTEGFGYDEMIRQSQVNVSTAASTPWPKSKAELRTLDRRSPKGELAKLSDTTRDRSRERLGGMPDRPNTRGVSDSDRSCLRHERTITERQERTESDRFHTGFSKKLKGGARKEKREHHSLLSGRKFGSVSGLSNPAHNSPNRKKNAPSREEGQPSPTRRRARPNQTNSSGAASSMAGTFSSVRLSQQQKLPETMRSMRYTPEPTQNWGLDAWDDWQETHCQRATAVPPIESPSKLLEHKEKELIARLKRLATLESEIPSQEADDVVRYMEPGLILPSTPGKEPRNLGDTFLASRYSSESKADTMLPHVETSSPSKTAQRNAASKSPQTPHPGAPILGVKEAPLAGAPHLVGASSTFADTCAAAKASPLVPLTAAPENTKPLHHIGPLSPINEQACPLAPLGSADWENRAPQQQVGISHNVYVNEGEKKAVPHLAPLSTADSKTMLNIAAPLHENDRKMTPLAPLVSAVDNKTLPKSVLSFECATGDNRTPHKSFAARSDKIGVPALGALDDNAEKNASVLDDDASLMVIGEKNGNTGDGDDNTSVAKPAPGDSADIHSRFDGFACARRSHDDVVTSEIFFEPQGFASMDGNVWVHQPALPPLPEISAAHHHCRTTHLTDERDAASPRFYATCPPQLMAAAPHVQHTSAPFTPRHSADTSLGFHDSADAPECNGVKASRLHVDNAEKMEDTDEDAVIPARDMANSCCGEESIGGATVGEYSSPTLMASPRLKDEVTFPVLAARPESICETPQRHWEHSNRLDSGLHGQHAAISAADPKCATQPPCSPDNCLALQQLASTGPAGMYGTMGSTAQFAPRARPFTPPVVPVSQLMKAPFNIEAPECIEVMFDPLLNIYYDPLTNKYYELRESNDIR
eukprot:GEMP01007349.1.p1 GENE.GEMP01007349.1~~GEMP01007349.1.p1  ORF type:complete len:1107 (+),score=299.75 GEMP01007349.1:334-3654(+)